MIEAKTFPLNALAEEVHEANAKWWINLDTGKRIDRNLGELLMLCVSELSEALEGHRKQLRDDKLPHRMMAEVELADVYIRLLDISGGYQLDLDGALLRIESAPPSMIGYLEWGYESTANFGECLLKIVTFLVKASFYRVTDKRFAETITATLRAVRVLAYDLNLDLMGAYTEKMAYNAVRADHQLEARKAAGGKKY